MFHEPLWAGSQLKIDPAGLHIPVWVFCRGARCGFVSKAGSRQGGLAALRCILPQGAHRALFSGMRRISACALSSHEVTHD